MIGSMEASIHWNYLIAETTPSHLPPFFAPDKTTVCLDKTTIRIGHL